MPGADHAMTALAAVLKQRIDATGPISIADYMTECLMHPTHGYYTTRDPFGKTGDFVTAPEISQMFGEVLGLAIAQSWIDQGAPKPFYLVELGPGRGTCMADILRATKNVPGFHDAASVQLVEASPTLRKIQSDTISHPATHHDRIEDIPEGPIFLIANEFLDALPIRQFQSSGDHWHERMIGVKDGAFVFGLSKPIDILAHRKGNTTDGDIVEVSPAAAAIASRIGARIAKDKGVAIFIDYGDWRSLGDTLQALRSHQPEDIFANPGKADLTAHVDFEALNKAAHPALTSPMIPQGVLLERLGITARAQALAKVLSGETLEAHIAAHRRLTHPEEMGTLFKALAIYPPDLPAPPGFESL